nr:dihydropteroate synthase [Microbacterium mangrovi]
MAIVNRTPDSFYDRGATFALDAAVAAGMAAFDAGADIVDVGGVKFAPGPAVPVDEECARVVPVVEALSCRGAVSVDTFQPEVAAAVIAAGASIVNDTTGLRDPRMVQVVAGSDAAIVIAHSLAEPRTPYPEPRYTDVAREVRAQLDHRVAVAIAHGVPRDRIVVDPGHDLNKSTRQTLELTRRLGELSALGLPMLVALSNKDFIGETLDRDRGDRLAGSLATAVWCVTQGARLVRAHNVRETVDAMRMIEAVHGWREPVRERHNTPPQGDD